MDRLAAAAALRAAGRSERADAHLAECDRLIRRLGAALPVGEPEPPERRHSIARLLAKARGVGQEDTMSDHEREELGRLRAFHSLVMDSDPADPDSILAAFASCALLELGFARGLVLVSATGGDELSCRVARDAAGRDIAPADRRAPDQLLRLALKRGEPVVSVGLQGDPSVAWEGSVADMAVQAFAAVPVVTPGGARVVAYFDGPPPARDVAESLRRLAPVLRDLGALLDRARRVKTRADAADALLSSMDGGGSPIVGSSPGIESLRQLIRIVAPADASVLVVGENGTGKELVARELHERSRRKDGPMLARSCAELADTLLESELFGHERGAFTGASRERAGLFQAASGGTLFLDEVGEMSPSLQAKLLRVLETGEVTRVGSTRTQAVDVRVVAATHRDLAAGVKAGTFRQDLYYRLKVIELRVPPLRERRGDVALLAHHFLAACAAGRPRAPRGFTHDALRALAQHDWPGNVRELRNAIERAIILGGDRDEIGLDLLPPEMLPSAAPLADSGSGSGASVTGKDLRGARDAFERACIEQALQQSGGNRTHAARALRISVRSLQQKLARHGFR